MSELRRDKRSRGRYDEAEGEAKATEARRSRSRSRGDRVQLTQSCSAMGEGGNLYFNVCTGPFIL